MASDLHAEIMSDYFNTHAKKIVDLEELSDELIDLYEQNLNETEKLFLQTSRTAPIGFLETLLVCATQRVNDECEKVAHAKGQFNLRLLEGVRYLRKRGYTTATHKPSGFYIYPDDKAMFLVDGATLGECYPKAMELSGYPELTQKTWDIAKDAFDACENVQKSLIRSIPGGVKF